MSEEDKIIRIAIDGPAGSGKSTIAQNLAEILQINYLNSGALYRIIGYYLDLKGINPKDLKGVERRLEEINIKIRNNHYFLNREDVTDLIKDSRIGELASMYSQISLVRNKVNKIIKNISKDTSIVVDGRDIGTVVLPDSDVKIFLTASIEERAKRRWEEEKERNKNTSYQQILAEIKRRDSNDSKRSLAPLKPAKDAFIIDTTSLSIDQVLNKILNLLKEKKMYGD